MKKEKKPFYKRGWFIGLAVFLAFGFITGLTQGGEQEESEQQEVEANDRKSNDEEKEQSEKKEQPKEESEEEETEEQEVKELDDFSMAEFSVEDMSATIEDGILHLSFRWINQSGDKAPFTSLAYLDVHQGDELLEEVSGSYDVDNKTGVLFKNANGGGHRVDLEYELKNEDDIELLFGSTIEGVNQKEEQTIELN